MKLQLDAATVQALTRTLKPRAASYEVPGLGTVRWMIQQTVIKDADGRVEKTIG